MNGKQEAIKQLSLRLIRLDAGSGQTPLGWTIPHSQLFFIEHLFLRLRFL